MSMIRVNRAVERQVVEKLFELLVNGNAEVLAATKPVLDKVKVINILRVQYTPAKPLVKVYVNKKKIGEFELKLTPRHVNSVEAFDEATRSILPMEISMSTILNRHDVIFSRQGAGYWTLSGV